jgi:hypothetical protein
LLSAAPSRLFALVVALAGLVCCAPHSAWAQAGPPYLTNDPGTPGNANWEINLGTMATSTHATTSWQLPQLDLNYGLGDRIQLTYEVPYVLQSGSGQPSTSGWSNAFIGVKWRFLDQGDSGWQVSMFPQVEPAGSAAAQRRGIAGDGPRLLLPLEASKKFGWLAVDFEAGWFVPRNGPDERIFGLVAGHEFSERLEVDAELYSDRASGAPPNDTTFDVGFRYQLHPAFILLCMAGRSVGANSDVHAQFIGYLGVQILLSDYGRSLRGAAAKAVGD